MADTGTNSLWVERIHLTGFRNYVSAGLETGPEPVVLIGDNGSGKTNLLEAVSLLAPGQGLRRAAFADIPNAKVGDQRWAVAARVHTAVGAVDIGTGIQRSATGGNASGRQVRIDGDAKSGSGVLAEYVELVWVTPAMDGLFTGGGSDRRRFLDRLVLCFDAGFRTRAQHFERAMQARNRLLSDGIRDPRQLDGLETIMAETGVALAAARFETLAALRSVIEARTVRDAASPFPAAELALVGTLERQLGERPAVEIEDTYARTLRFMRDRDAAAGRTLEGPHRCDLIVNHAAKAMPAKLCSTGEQKALLLGIVLAHTELLAKRQNGRAPLLLLDEIAAHLDEQRRAALFDEVLRLGSQAWMTGTEGFGFAHLSGRASGFLVSNGTVRPQAI